MEEPSLKEFIKDINSLGNDHRYRILTLQLYSEHYVNQILMCLVNEGAMGKEVREQIPFPKKIGILERTKIINHDMVGVLITLSELRNTAIHNLMIDQKIIKSKLGSRKLGFNYEVNFNKDGKDMVGINLEEMFKEANATEYAQFDVSTMLAIGILYTRLQTIKKQEVKFILFPELKENSDGSFIINITVSERASDQKIAKELAEKNNSEQQDEPIKKT